MPHGALQSSACVGYNDCLARFKQHVKIIAGITRGKDMVMFNSQQVGKIEHCRAFPGALWENIQIAGAGKHHHARLSY